MKPIVYKEKITKYFWLIITLLCVFYAPMTSEYFVHFIYADAPQLWLKFFTWVAGEQHTMGAGSAVIVQDEIYTKTRYSMLLHSASGGILILLASLQFYKPFRKKHPQVHRTVGKIYAVLILLSMAGSINFLLVAGPEQTFNGLAFYLQLWLLAAGTLGSLILAILAIQHGHRLAHQTAMLFNFAMLLSAPILRIEWLIFGGLIEGITQQESNLFSFLIFGFLIVPSTIIASRLIDHRGFASASSAAAQKIEELSSIANKYLMVIGIISTICIIIFYIKNFGSLSLFSNVFIGLLATVLFLYVVMLRRSKSLGHHLAYFEWRIHLQSLYVLPIIFLPSWLVLCSITTPWLAFVTVSCVLPAGAFGLGYLIVGISRLNVKVAKKL